MQHCIQSVLHSFVSVYFAHKHIQTGSCLNMLILKFVTCLSIEFSIASAPQNHTPHIECSHSVQATIKAINYFIYCHKVHFMYLHSGVKTQTICNTLRLYLKKYNLPYSTFIFVTLCMFPLNHSDVARELQELGILFRPTHQTVKIVFYPQFQKPRYPHFLFPPSY